VAAPRLTVPQDLAAAFAHPPWLVERWSRHYGIAAAEAICRWDQEPAGITLRLDDPAIPLPGADLPPGAFLSRARRLVRGDPGTNEAIRSGFARIQDEASQLVAELAVAAAPDALTVLDTCAAPGGKTAILAERLPRATLTAIDVSRRRLQAMQSRFEPPARGKAGSASPARLRWLVADAAALPLRPEHDLVLCDVPCSGTGTIGRNPEIRLRLTKQDLSRQQERQAAILQSALAGLAANGVLVYASCSLEPEENEAVIARVIGHGDGWALRPVRPILERLAQRGVVTAEGRELLETAVQGLFLRTIPGVHPCDGFFAAVLQRV
jgi:16S rRNA (cytosine967-C5)-methyltransferase